MRGSRNIAPNCSDREERLPPEDGEGLKKPEKGLAELNFVIPSDLENYRF